MNEVDTNDIILYQHSNNRVVLVETKSLNSCFLKRTSFFIFWRI